ncbi:hypothetical protein NA78x_001096 [Anatilimnocola sp. NA78]|uniref:hypothetical protein n=1 Tax=Anatilimnocola sp. NA78 TaxID=3415683 RepID=UPI003CE58E77
MVTSLRLVCVAMICLAIPSFSLAQEPASFDQFFEKDQIVHLLKPTDSEFVTATILKREERQQLIDARSLTVAEMLEKYPQLQAQMDAATKAVAENQKKDGQDRESSKLTPRLYSSLSPQLTYRVIAAKPDYLLVESFGTPAQRHVYAMHNIRRINWFSGLTVQMIGRERLFGSP